MKISVTSKKVELAQVSNLSDARKVMKSHIDDSKTDSPLYHKLFRMVHLGERKVGNNYQDSFGFYEKSDRDLKDAKFCFELTYHP